MGYITRQRPLSHRLAITDSIILRCPKLWHLSWFVGADIKPHQLLYELVIQVQQVHSQRPVVRKPSPELQLRELLHVGHALEAHQDQSADSYKEKHICDSPRPWRHSTSFSALTFKKKKNRKLQYKIWPLAETCSIKLVSHSEELKDWNFGPSEQLSQICQ